MRDRGVDGVGMLIRGQRQGHRRSESGLKLWAGAEVVGWSHGGVGAGFVGCNNG